VTLVSGNRDGPAIANMTVLNLLPRGKPEPRDLFRFKWTRKRYKTFLMSAAPRGACVGGRDHARCLSHIALKQSSITLEVPRAAWLFVCAIKRGINNTRVFSVMTYRFLLIFQRFLTDCFPYVLFAFVKLNEISFRSKLV